MIDILYKIKKETKFILINQITWDKLETGNQDFLMPLYKNNKLKRRYATSLTEYIYYFTFNEVDNFKNLKKYSYELRKIINYSRVRFREKFGDYRFQHFLEPNSSQWCLCTDETYNQIIKEFNIDKWENFRTYDDLKKEFDECRHKFTQPYFGFDSSTGVEDMRNNIRPYSTVWHYKRDEEVYKKHLTPKPVKMIEHIINVSSNENDIVLDCFMGSGTTGVACKHTNRQFIGIELDKKYFDIAKQRIESE